MSKKPTQEMIDATLRRYTPERRRATAYHEAAHAIAATAGGETVLRVTIKPEVKEGALGTHYIAIGEVFSHGMTPENIVAMIDRFDFDKASRCARDVLRFCFAGDVGSEIAGLSKRDRREGAGIDRQYAAAFLNLLLCKNLATCGMDGVPQFRGEASTVASVERARAVALIRKRSQLHAALASALTERETLGQVEYEEIITRVAPDFAEEASETREGFPAISPEEIETRVRDVRRFAAFKGVEIR